METGREVVIVEAVRTPVGRGHREKGYYKDVHPNVLLGKVYTEVLDRAGVRTAAAGRGRGLADWPVSGVEWPSPGRAGRAVTSF